MIKKIIISIFFILSIYNLTSCSNSFYYEYNNAYLLEKENVYKKISKDVFYEKIKNKESFIVYYGQPECTTCFVSVGFIDQHAKEAGINTIYYLKSEILNLTNSNLLADELQANIGFDDNNNPYGAPRLWCFIEGEYTTGMSNFLDEGETTYLEASKKLFAYYNNQQKWVISCLPN